MASRRSASSRASSARPKSTVHRILIVDDSRMSRAMAMKHLKDYFLMAEAPDGAAAWQMIQQDPSIKMVLTDIEMPNLDGLGLLDQLRASTEQALQELPVFVMAKESGAPTIEEARQRGANWVFDHSVPWDTVLTMVDRALEGRRDFSAVESSIASPLELEDSEVRTQTESWSTQTSAPEPPPVQSPQIDLQIPADAFMKTTEFVRYQESAKPKVLKIRKATEEAKNETRWNHHQRVVAAPGNTQGMRVEEVSAPITTSDNADYEAQVPEPDRPPQLPATAVAEDSSDAVDSSPGIASDVSPHDLATGLFSRAGMLTHAERLLHEDPSVQLSLQIIHLDSYDALKKLHGERIALMLLKQFSHMLLRMVRTDDLCCRFTESEFALLSNRLSGANVLAFAMRLRDAVETAMVSYRGHSLRINISVGVGHMETDRCSSFEELLALCQRRVERARSGGGNRVVGAGDRTVNRRAMFSLDQAAGLLDACDVDAVRPYVGTLAARLMPMLRLINQELLLNLNIDAIDHLINAANKDAPSRLEN